MKDKLFIRRISEPSEPLLEDICIERDAETGITYLTIFQGEVCPRWCVEQVLKACQSHLANLSPVDLRKINDGRARRWDEIRNEPLHCDGGQKLPYRDGFVYLMRNQRNGLTKIGFSNNPQFREKTLQSEEPEIELIHSWPGTMETEGGLHDLFASKRMRGEWFNLDHEDIVSIEERMNAKA